MGKGKGRVEVKVVGLWCWSAREARGENLGMTIVIITEFHQISEFEAEKNPPLRPPKRYF